MSKFIYLLFLSFAVPLALQAAGKPHLAYAEASKPQQVVVPNGLDNAALEKALASTKPSPKAVTIYLPDHAGTKDRQALEQMGRTLSSVKNLKSLTLYGGNPMYVPCLYDALNSKSLETLVLGFNGSFSYKAMLKSKKEKKGIYPLMRSYYPIPLINNMPRIKKVHYKGLFYTSERITDTLLVSRGTGSRGVTLVMDGASTPAKRRFKTLDVVRKAQNLDKVLDCLTYEQVAKLSQENKARWANISIIQKPPKPASQ